MEKGTKKKTYIEDLEILQLNRFMLEVRLALRQRSINFVKGNPSTALNDTLADPSVTFGHGAVMGVDAENNADR
jgi:hypothetical protein